MYTEKVSARLRLGAAAVFLAAALAGVALPDFLAGAMFMIFLFNLLRSSGSYRVQN